ncbi:MAG TPA: di-heme oxidoredictase family protein [Blastocatellia bacterium]|nr:di-heme oxidoredictase family protein [Blastocatellia bacterium]
MRLLKGFMLIAVALLALLLADKNGAASAQSPSTRIGEQPALAEHISQADIESGAFKFKKLLEIGEAIFAARWNKLDGQGRPAATGNGAPTRREPSHDSGFLRTSGPDATSCADCHNQPTVGGAGGFVANVFVLAQNHDPVTDSVSAEFSNERNTLGMNGSGAIEMLAREMSADLIAIREAARAEARASGGDVTKSLDTKGVNFGRITMRPDGTGDTSGVEGVDADLIIKPFHQKGVVNSVRVFTVNAFNHHHGMQAVERFGVGQKDNRGNIITTNDFDEDGVADELTVGDITAATLFQAAMNIPGRVIASDPTRRAAAERGEARFAQIGCADCHKPALMLNSPLFSEPNPFNPPGNLRLQDGARPFTFDLTRDVPKPRLERSEAGGAIVRAYTDLKRHVICDDEDPFFCNERLIQGGVPVAQFLTRKLWDVGNTAPYGHRGDLTTITEAILHHAGEARPQRERFAALPTEQQAEIIEFLKQLQALPNGAPRVVTEDELRVLVKRQKRVQVSAIRKRFE